MDVAGVAVFRHTGAEDDTAILHPHHVDRPVFRRCRKHSIEAHRHALRVLHEEGHGQRRLARVLLWERQLRERVAGEAGQHRKCGRRRLHGKACAIAGSRSQGCVRPAGLGRGRHAARRCRRRSWPRLLLRQAAHHEEGQDRQQQGKPEEGEDHHGALRAHSLRGPPQRNSEKLQGVRRGSIVRMALLNPQEVLEKRRAPRAGRGGCR
mmetsp:Transcript_20334/g.48252  ORF Transcript_20334/g.48252 Transcript_20334/m.48252 type:complete len:208 (+) Transcript_20334:515-1138(+)